MGFVYRRKVHRCSTCGGRARPACAAAGHAVETTVARIWWVRWSRGGRKFSESSESPKKRDAERLLKLREGDVARGLPVAPAQGRVRFEEAARDLATFNANRGRRPDGRIKLHLAPAFGGRRLATITAADLQDYVATRRREGAKNGTINRELSKLRRVFNLARRNRKLSAEHVPTFELLPEHDAVRQGFFDEVSVGAVLAHLPVSIRPAVEFAYVTGWRKEEVLNLQWRHVAGDEVRLAADETKSRHPRRFPLNARLTELLDEQRAVHARLLTDGVVSPFVFPRLRGARPGHRLGSIRKAWATACTRAGVPGRLFHDLRRSAVRNLVRSGIAEAVAMRLTGHLSRSVFERYNIVSDDDLRTAVSRLGYAQGYTRPSPSTGSTTKSKKR